MRRKTRTIEPPRPLSPTERAANQRKRRKAARERSDADFLQVAKIVAGHPFAVGCGLAGVEPTEAEVSRWRSGKGRALSAAWKHWPRSKNLPRLAFGGEA